ncbi:type III secretion protein [Pseudomonas sp. ICMP 8385]|uniref:Type III secretion protein n=1 Tax=Pseudomonas gessardii TaxID=78544 RepID=A0ABS9F0G7_9PSED|nr:type III secretion protein [Pseudomonas gessardii]PHN65486.1 type III secretion protein [Pseudomonas sp. ICMP 8385]MBH3425397.1 type III secretion protein [Pseudomonas gessardii]MCF4982344.1 type III secretion protein [Pseudomonas gessardii]MCF4993022.1 type III secretion protein [Pseudomonas gessardii]MCF5088148.1 type III secretion protein [Pseudomonas gessardii]
MNDLISHWFSSRQEQLIVFEGDDEINLRRHAHTLLLSVQLTHNRPEKSLLTGWMRLGGVSLNHFQGALSQAPGTGMLWLVQCLHTGCAEKQLLEGIESLLNQRDTWRAIVARQARPPQKLTPTSLRLLPH